MDVNTEIALRLLAIILLLFFSAFFSAAEAAVFALGRLRMSRLALELPDRGPAIKSLLAMPRRLIVTILAGNVLANVLLAIMTAYFFIMLMQDKRWLVLPRIPAEYSSLVIIVLSVLSSVVLILVFGEVIPRVIAVRFSRPVTAMVVRPLYYFSRVIYPLRRGTRSLSDVLISWLGGPPEQAWDGMGEPQLRDLVEKGERHGMLDVTERKLLSNIFEFGDISVAEVMTPRSEIFSLSAQLDPEDIIRQVRARGLSRVPIYERERDHIIGVLHVKNLLRLRISPQGEVPIKSLIREPVFVSPAQSINKLLAEFKIRRVHLALVADDFGVLVGLVTMEDILEEIFGEIRDLHAPRLCREVGRHRFLISGRMEISEFNETFAAALEGDGIRTVGGLLVQQLGRIPDPGEAIEYHGFTFHVKERSGPRISQLEVECAVQGEEGQ